MNIYEKLLKIQNELKAPKNQRNNFGGYNYRSCEDILEAIKPILEKYKATVVLKDDVINIGDRYYIVAIVDFVDVETGEKITAQAQARESEAKKGMDDSQISGTASSYARKYALNGLFLIDDTKDADTDEFSKVVQNKISKKMIDSLIEAIRNKGYTKGHINDVLQKYGYKQLEDVKTNDLANIKKDLEI